MLTVGDQSKVSVKMELCLISTRKHISVSKQDYPSNTWRSKVQESTEDNKAKLSEWAVALQVQIGHQKKITMRVAQHLSRLSEEW